MDLRGLIVIVIVLAVISFVLWLINVRMPGDSTIKMIINFIVVLAVILWLLNAFGILSGVGHPLH